MGPDQALKAAIPLLGAAEAAAALGASLRLRRDEQTVSPDLARGLDGVLDALGVRDAVGALDEQQSMALLGIVEGFLTQAADFVAEPARAGWDHHDARILMAQGHSSVLVAGALKRFVVPALGDDLAHRLEAPGAAFLDVGAGVGALSVAMCRIWPSLRVVAVDSWEPALELAREQIAAAGLQQRIELRPGVIQALEDVGAFDLAWMPTFFISRTALEPAIERMHAAMRTGGWATFGLYARPGDRFVDALADLRTVRQGGALIAPLEVARLLERAGFCDVDVVFDVTWQLPIVFVAGRRG